MQHVLTTFYLYCEWEHIAPTYRLYLDDELMTERTYEWDNIDQVLQERVQSKIDLAIPHTIKIEQLEPRTGIFEVKQLKSVDAVYDPIDVDINVTIS